MSPHLSPTDPTTAPALPPQAANGQPHHRPRPDSRPRRRRSWLPYLALGLLLALGAVGLAAALGLAGDVFPSLFPSSRPDLITHKVRSEYLQVTVVERGTLESAQNMDLVCKVKAGSKGTFASTIRWVIDDGSIVQKGQLLMELDDSALDEQLRTLSFAV
jgi:multidrug efflux pump subunit AcrA (membrane-fusion protein)